MWESLLAVADAAGGDWPSRARVAAVALVAESRESTSSLGIRLLADLKTVFGDAHALATDDIITSLVGIEEAPWGELVRGKPLNARGLAWRLSEYGVKSKTVRIGATTPRGYVRADLWDAWTRYFPSPSPSASATSATSTTRPVDEVPNVAGVADVADFQGEGDHVAPRESFGVKVVEIDHTLPVSERYRGMWEPR